MSYGSIELSREQAVELFRRYANQRLYGDQREEGDKKWLEPLKDAEALVCWCSPKLCHAEVLVELINANYG